MPAETLTESERAAQVVPASSVQDDELRAWARSHVELVHR